MENKNTYEFKVLKQVELGDCVQSTIMFFRQDNKQLDVDEVKGLGVTIAKRGATTGTKVEYMIRGLVGDKWATLKTKSADNMDIKDFEEYYEGRVQETAKFEKFSQIQIVVWRNKKDEEKTQKKTTKKK